MATGSKITVANNGTILSIENSTIKSDKLNVNGNFTWIGIVCEGDHLSSQGAYCPEQYFTLPNPQTPDDPIAYDGVLNIYTNNSAPYNTMPYVKLKNVTIQDALIGVNSKCGGVVQGFNSSFMNNEVGAKIEDYISPAKPQVNACKFMGCSFITDNFNSNFTRSKLVGISLKGVKGINIGNCFFRNIETAATCPLDRSIGILANAATFVAGNSGDRFCYDAMGCITNCNDNPDYDVNFPNDPIKGKKSLPGSGCEFQKLLYGIRFISTTGNNVNFAAKDGKFFNNYRGISATHTGNYPGNAKIIGNTFTSTRAELQSTFSNINGCYTGLGIRNIDVALENMQNDVYSNTFSFDNTLSWHVYILNNSSMGRISRNTFTNLRANNVASDDIKGVFITGICLRQQIFCNTFNEMGTDIKVDINAKIQNPVSGKNAGDAAMNSFSDVLPGRLRIDNSGNPILDYLLPNPNAYPKFDPLAPPSSSINVTKHSGGGSVTFEDVKKIVMCKMICDDLLKDNDWNTAIKEVSKTETKVSYIIENQNLTILSKLSTIKQITLYNLSGQLISQNEITANKFEININALASGLYVVKVELDNNDFETIKFIKQ